MSNPLIHYGLVLLVFICHSITTFRLLSYQRGMSNYRSSVSLLAWLLMVCTGSRALDILLHLKTTSITPDQAGIALLLCILVWRTRGNVAALLRDY